MSKKDKRIEELEAEVSRLKIEIECLNERIEAQKMREMERLKKSMEEQMKVAFAMDSMREELRCQCGMQKG